MPDTDGYGWIQGVLTLTPAMGEGIDIANAALFLASDEASFVNGQILGVDAGWSAL